MQPQVTAVQQQRDPLASRVRIVAPEVCGNGGNFAAQRAAVLIEQDARRALGRGRGQSQRCFGGQSIFSRPPDPLLGGQSLGTFPDQRSGNRVGSR